MNPTLKEPNTWMQINFSSLLSKSQSFDEVAHRKAKRMRLLYDQTNPDEAQKEQQAPLNMHPTAVGDLYNNPTGFFLNQVNPGPVVHTDLLTDQLIYGNQALGANEMVPVDAFQNQSNPALVNNEGFNRAELPALAIDGLVTDLSPAHRQPKAPKLEDDVPIGFDYASELKRIYDARKYSGFADYFAVLKKIYPFIEKVRTKSQLQNWFNYHHYQRAAVVVEEKKPRKSSTSKAVLAVRIKTSSNDCVEIPPAPKGFDYQKEFQEEYDTGVHQSGAAFVNAITKKFPFIHSIKSKTQIAQYFQNRKYRKLPAIPQKPSTTKNEKLAASNSVNIVVPKEFDYQKEFQAEYDTEKYLTATPFVKAVETKFPFIHSFKTKQQIRNWFNGKKMSSKKRKFDFVSSIASSIAPSVASSEASSVVGDLQDFQDSQNSVELFNAWLDAEDDNLHRKLNSTESSSKPAESPICFSESPNIAAVASTFSAESVKNTSFTSPPAMDFERPIMKIAPIQELLSPAEVNPQVDSKLDLNRQVAPQVSEPVKRNVAKTQTSSFDIRDVLPVPHDTSGYYPAIGETQMPNIHQSLYDSPTASGYRPAPANDYCYRPSPSTDNYYYPAYAQDYHHVYYDDHSHGYNHYPVTRTDSYKPAYESATDGYSAQSSPAPTNSYSQTAGNSSLAPIGNYNQSRFQASPALSDGSNGADFSPADDLAPPSTRDILQPQLNPEEVKDTPIPAPALTDQSQSPPAKPPTEQTVPSCLSEYGEFFNTPSMKFLDNFFEETLFG